MSGHSKWANIKHKKARMDAKKGKVFTRIAKELTVAAKQGGGDVEANARLKAAIQKAKEANMPNDNIERAIKKGTGEIEGVVYEEINYEGYGPAGVAVLMDVATDNRNRTAAEIRHLFAKHGGNLGESGCVAWMFERKGYITVDMTEEMDGEEIMLVAIECGAEDVFVEEDTVEITTSPESLDQVKEQLDGQGFSISEAEVTMIPSNTIKVTDENDGEKLLKLMEILEDHDDVQNAYANFDIDDNLMEKISL
ncbi:YebC/PmpR family DNA-binding transcriptional regulator [Metallumcola ferriviriculae]|uniref:Probable transcriptional regulatory protein MFMK1_003071 n=1 Tax=Metallumcola ferriviriculae TaxID=3039180 RepID=A0AAU0USF4_9FIRM|nr:YebC/PmpR family DNA-binding transcriptional regulator [Desulfitibacteraceae bacterium MK1]